MEQALRLDTTHICRRSAGDESNQDEPVSIHSSAEVGGKAFFGVITFKAESLDWFQLQRVGNRRAILDYDDLGVLIASRWVNP